ncbi:MAG: ATP-binding protein [Candidatus Sericytochromatia bacterium]|nr:ATP-binding protein [Candidatus Sericytochromatia bacterium]
MSLVKVVFDGAPGTGKSKTLEAIRQFFAMSNNLRQMFNLPTFKVGFVKEAAWDLFEAHPDINRGALATQRTILDMMTEREAEHRHCDIVFIDRGAYSINVYEKLFGMESMASLQADIDRLTSGYDMVYLFHPDNVILRNNGVRIEDEETRMGLHNAFLDHLQTLRLPHRVLFAENTERAGTVIGDILALLQKKGIPMLV